VRGEGGETVSTKAKPLHGGFELDVSAPQFNEFLAFAKKHVDDLALLVDNGLYPEASITLTLRKGPKPTERA
jgi:hypothetical protein